MIDVRDQENLRDWRDALSRLEADISTWSKEQGWRIEEEPVQLEEHGLGPYEAHRIRVLVPNDIQPRRFLVVEPVARNVAFADGRVDLIAWPTFDRVRLVLMDGIWKVQTLGGPDWPAAWGKDTFIDLAQRLVQTP